MTVDRLGELYAVLSVVAFALGGVAVAKARESGPGDGGALLSVVLTVAFSGIVWLAAGRLRGSWLVAGASLGGLAWFALSGVLSTAMGRALYFLSVHELGAIRASAVKRAIPFFSVIFGVVLLGEVLTGPKLGGIVLIALSIGALAAFDLRAARRSGGTGAGREASLVGYAWGTASGLSYAASYVARKLGLNLIPDGAFGTFAGALAALLYYVCAAGVSPRRRRASVAALTARNGWAVAAALGFSLGQIANFYAIQFTAVSTVGVIQALEVFISMIVAALILRTERVPSALTIAAALLATFGVLLVIAR